MTRASWRVRVWRRHASGRRVRVQRESVHESLSTAHTARRATLNRRLASRQANRGSCRLPLLSTGLLACGVHSIIAHCSTCQRRASCAPAFSPRRTHNPHPPVRAGRPERVARGWSLLALSAAKSNLPFAMARSATPWWCCVALFVAATLRGGAGYSSGASIAWSAERVLFHSA